MFHCHKMGRRRAIDRQIKRRKRNMGEKRGDKGMEEQSKGTVLMQSGWTGLTGVTIQKHENAVRQPGGKGDKVMKGIEERKKQIIFPIITEGSCASSNITGRKF
jgi:hypothetical protein